MTYREDPEEVELKSLCNKLMWFSTAMKLLSIASGETKELLKLTAEFTLDDIPDNTT